MNDEVLMNCIVLYSNSESVNQITRNLMIYYLHLNRLSKIMS